MIALIVKNALSRLWNAREGPSEESEDNFTGYVPYELVDAIASERERVKNIENLISVIEATMNEESESGIQINFADASGQYRFHSTANEALLQYLYSERAQIRKEISEKIRTISN